MLYKYRVQKRFIFELQPVKDFSPFLVSKVKQCDTAFTRTQFIYL